MFETVGKNGGLWNNYCVLVAADEKACVDTSAYIIIGIHDVVNIEIKLNYSVLR